MKQMSCWSNLPVDIWAKIFVARFACKSPLDDSDIKIAGEARTICKQVDAALTTSASCDIWRDIALRYGFNGSAFAYIIAPHIKRLVCTYIHQTEALQHCVSLESVKLTPQGTVGFCLGCDWHSILDSLQTGPKAIQL